MIDDLKDIITRSPTALLQDAAGITAIGVMMVVALNIPSFF